MSPLDSGHFPVPSFPFHLLPLHLQEFILSLLPISSLLRLLPISRSFLSLLRSSTFLSLLHHDHHHRDDLFFFLFTDLLCPSPSFAAAFHPSSCRWLLLPLPSSFSDPHASSSSLAVVDHKLAAGTLTLAAARLLSRSPPLALPPMIPILHPYVLAVIDDGVDHFKVVAVSTGDRVYSQVYDSRRGRWELTGQFDGRFAVLGSAKFLDGLLFVLSYGPDRLLSFNPGNGRWKLVDVEMPAKIVSSHLLVFEKELFLVGGLEELGEIAKIGIWRLNLSEMEWRVVCFMPDEFFGKFGHYSGRFYHFEAIGEMGMICLYNADDSQVLIFDLMERKWWWPPPCHLIPENRRRRWFGHAVLPSINLLKPFDGG
ncbi:F-box/kelch-repeat protein At5g43190-like [Typha angustifolia]|uniref:F-box/kelch-repeat protein At5g43190-like n=1 Tax=Typha angustifolia TaxID=59011 RepID=UPI003C2D8D7F